MSYKVAKIKFGHWYNPLWESNAGLQWKEAKFRVKA